VHIILENHIGRNVEAYIDDIVVKSKKHEDPLDDLKETFDNLCKYKMILNPKNACLTYHQASCSAIWCHTLVQESGTKASIHVPRMFNSHA
jgi:Mg2+ and Co2+ transporter CorA